MSDCDAEADGEDRLAGRQGVVEQGAIGGFAAAIGVGGVRAARGAVTARVHVGAAAGENHGVERFGQAAEFVGREQQGNFDGFAAGFADGAEIIFEAATAADFFLGGAAPGARRCAAPLFGLMRES